MGKLWNRSPRKTLEFRCWETSKPGLEKALSNLTSPCMSPALPEIGLKTSRSPFQPKRFSGSRWKTHWGGWFFAPLVMLRDSKHCLEDKLSPGATATLKPSFYSHWSKKFSATPVTFISWKLGSMVVLRASLHYSQSQPLVGKVANPLMMRQSQAARKDCVSKLKFPWTCENKPFPWWPFLCGVAAARSGSYPG